MKARGTLLIAAALAACGGEEPTGSDALRKAGAELEAQGVDRYALEMLDARWEVELFDVGGESVGRMAAELVEGAPVQVDLQWKGRAFAFAPDGELVAITDGETVLRARSDEGTWSTETGAPLPPEVSGALALTDALSAEILNGGPIEKIDEQPYGSSVTGWCSSAGLLSSCGDTHNCAVGNALSRCSNGGYLIGVACSCGWWSKYCQATAYCY